MSLHSSLSITLLHQYVHSDLPHSSLTITLLHQYVHSDLPVSEDYIHPYHTDQH
ncbi:uncharacterized protein LOC143084281 [Mytilus galloprovincialis]|uniref:uncharacterized protein LOC143084281 n=1 Tax=Mytilus galloprovincialis TaxID=29158 RepID=UPI003F7B4C04